LLHCRVDCKFARKKNLDRWANSQVIPFWTSENQSLVHPEGLTVWRVSSDIGIFGLLFIDGTAISDVWLTRLNVQPVSTTRCHKSHQQCRASLSSWLSREYNPVEPMPTERERIFVVTSLKEHSIRIYFSPKSLKDKVFHRNRHRIVYGLCKFWLRSWVIFILVCTKFVIFGGITWNKLAKCAESSVGISQNFIQHHRRYTLCQMIRECSAFS
jgi:hypothetical protein